MWERRAKAMKGRALKRPSSTNRCLGTIEHHRGNNARITLGFHLHSLASITCRSALRLTCKSYTTPFRTAFLPQTPTRFLPALTQREEVKVAWIFSKTFAKLDEKILE